MHSSGINGSGKNLSAKQMQHANLYKFDKGNFGIDLTRGEINCQIQPFAEIDFGLGEEFDYVEEEKANLKKSIDERNKEADKRYERVSKVAQRIFQNQEQKKKREEDEQNAEFARQLESQERD